MGTRTAYQEQAQCIGNRHSVSQTGTAYREQAQCIGNRHSVSGIGTSYHEQAQRIGNRHSVSQTGTAYREQAQRITKRHSLYIGNRHSVLPRTENQDSHRTFREEIQDCEQSTDERQLISQFFFSIPIFPSHVLKRECANAK